MPFTSKIAAGAFFAALLAASLLQAGCTNDYFGCLGPDASSVGNDGKVATSSAAQAEAENEVNTSATSSEAENEAAPNAEPVAEAAETIHLENVPAYSGDLSVEINGNVPFFTEADRTRGAFEEYSELDELGRAGIAFARISRDTMPEEERTGELTYKPTGWQVNTYDWVDYHFLYNRCHLIAWSLAAEDNNPQNLITGTRTLNMEGMRPFEEEVSRYVYRTNNTVLYRVTPIYWAGNLVASGVLMEAESVEDGGAGVQFCVYCYNVEPGVSINYATGENQADGTMQAPVYEPSEEEQAADFLLNKRSQVYHFPDCEAVADTRDYNKLYFQGTLEELQAEYPAEDGWRLCNICRENHAAELN